MFSVSSISFITCRNLSHMRNNVRYKGNINNTSIFLMGTLVFLCDLTKPPAMVLCLGEPPGGFCNVGCCYFPHWRFLHFRATFLCHRHSILASQASKGLHQLWALPWLLLVALLFARLFRHIFTASAKFLSGNFLPTGFFFYLALFPHIFGTFCDSNAARNTPSRILLCACAHRVVPSGWRMYLNYSYCSYNTTDLSLEPVSHEVNMFI